MVFPFVAGVFEKIQKNLPKHKIRVNFNPGQTLGQRPVHPKAKTTRYKLSNVVYALQCTEACSDFLGEIKQPLHGRMAQHRRATSLGQDSAVHLHLKEKGHSFEDSNVQVLDGEDRWFEREVKEAIHVHLEKPSLNMGGGLRQHLSATYNALLGALPSLFNTHTHLGPCHCKVSHETRGEGQTSDHIK